jgi:hypothetical protein
MRAAALALTALLMAGPAAADSSSSASSVDPAPAVEPTDAALESIVRAAYTAASSFAVAHGNYFARDGVYAPLFGAIAAAVPPDSGATVPQLPAADLAAARACLAAPGLEMRVVVNLYGDGIGLVAVTDRRVISYSYDPHEAADIAVSPAADCTKS